MVTPEELEALDLMCWLGHGDDAALLGYCNQSTISRRSTNALRIFDLHPSREFALHLQAGESPLLRMEREVHQLYRLRGRGRLRLHAPYWASRLLENQLGEGWVVNPAREKEPVGEALTLLEHRVIDAMITETRQRPADDNPRFACFDLYEVPLILCVEPNAQREGSSPLVFEKNLSRDDVGGLSLVKPQGFLSPESKKCVVELFNHLYGDPPCADDGSGKALDQGCYATFFMAHHPTVFQHFGHFRTVDCDCGFMAKESLVVLRGLDESPAVGRLLEMLSRSYLPAIGRYQDVIIHPAML